MSIKLYKVRFKYYGDAEYLNVTIFANYCSRHKLLCPVQYLTVHTEPWRLYVHACLPYSQLCSPTAFYLHQL